MKFQIHEFIDEMAAAYPDKVTVKSSGLSYWGNDMPVVKISTGGDGTKNAIFVDGGILSALYQKRGRLSK